jgi:hypothetical protein
MTMTNLYPTKNGLPWTSVYKFPETADPEKLSILQKCWEEVDWGDNFQNNRRNTYQNAIYPCTRVVTYNPRKSFTNKILEKAIINVSEDIKKILPIPMMLLAAELTLLVPKGFVMWHRDRMLSAHLVTRVMIPLTNNKGVKYSFCSWNENTPTDMVDFDKLQYLSDDKHEVEMETGFYYAFNHRVPHKTDSKSLEPRGMLMLDMIPNESRSFKETGFPVTEFEKTKLIPIQNFV